MVLRIHAESRGDGLDRLSARRDSDAVGARDRGVRPDLSRDDLETLHGAGPEGRAGPERVPGCDPRARVDVAHVAVRDERRVLLLEFERVLLAAVAADDDAAERRQPG